MILRQVIDFFAAGALPFAILVAWVACGSSEDHSGGFDDPDGAGGAFGDGSDGEGGDSGSNFDRAHVLEGSAPIGIQVMGYGDNTSYQYPGGLNLSAISAIPLK